MADPKKFSKDEGQSSPTTNPLVVEFKERVSSTTKQALAIIAALLVMWVNVFEHRGDLQKEALASALMAKASWQEAANKTKEAVKEFDKAARGDASPEIKDAENSKSIPAEATNEPTDIPTIGKDAAAVPKIAPLNLGKSAPHDDGISKGAVPLKKAPMPQAPLTLDQIAALRWKEIGERAAYVAAKSKFEECSGNVELLTMKLSLPLRIIGPFFNIVLLMLMLFLYWRRVCFWTDSAEIYCQCLSSKDSANRSRSPLSGKVPWWIAPMPSINISADTKAVNKQQMLKWIGWDQRNFIHAFAVGFFCLLITLLQYHIASQGVFFDPDGLAMLNQEFPGFMRRDETAVLGELKPNIAGWSVLTLVATLFVIWMWFRPKTVQVEKIQKAFNSMSGIGVLMALCVPTLILLLIFSPNTKLTSNDYMWALFRKNASPFFFAAFGVIGAAVLVETLLCRETSTEWSNRRRVLLRFVPIGIGAIAWKLGGEARLHLWWLAKKPRFVSRTRRRKSETNFIKISSLNAGTWNRNKKKPHRTISPPVTDGSVVAKTADQTNQSPSLPEGIVYYVSKEGYVLFGDNNPITPSNLTPAQVSPILAPSAGPNPAYLPKES